MKKWRLLILALVVLVLFTINFFLPTRAATSPIDCIHCVWIATGEDDFYRVESNALTTDLQHWQAPDRSATAFSVEYINGTIYYTDYTDDELVNMSLDGGTEHNAWSIAGFTSDVYGLCANDTHFFMPGKTDDVMHITTFTDPTTEVDTFSIYADTEGCFYHPDDDTIYIVYSADFVANYSVTGTEQTGPWELHADMSAPTGIVWNSTHWLISDDAADEIFILTTANLVGNTYTTNIDAVGTDLQGLAYAYVDNPPWSSNVQINDTGDVFTGEDVNHSALLEDFIELDTAIFSWNASGASCNVWENASDQALSGTKYTAYNITKIPSACAGKDIGFKFYFNDSGDQWNTTGMVNYSVYKYGNLAVNWTRVPSIYSINNTECSEASPCEFDQYETFNGSANVTCVGGSGAKCGTVTGSIRVNLTSASDPDYPVNTTEDDLPMFVSGISVIEQITCTNLTNIEDTYVYEVDADDNFGAVLSLSIQSLENANIRTWIKFNTSFNSSGHIVNIIVNATLSLYDWTGGASGRTYNLYNTSDRYLDVNVPWWEGDGGTCAADGCYELTWNNQTTVDTLQDGQTMGSAQWVNWTIGDAINSSFNSNKNISLTIRDSVEGVAAPPPGTNFRSKEATADTNYPYLTVCYNETVTTGPQNPTSFGSMDDTDFHILNFTVNVSTNYSTFSLIDFNFSSSYGNSNVPDNDTTNALLRLNKGRINITDCGDWALDDTEYVITMDLLNKDPWGDAGDPICLNFNVDDSIIDCDGYYVDGVSTTGVGMDIDGDNVTVRDCYIKDWDIGVELDGDYITFENVTIKNTEGNCFNFGVSQYQWNNFTNLTVGNCTSRGLQFTNIDNTNFTNVHINETGQQGVYWDYCDNNRWEGGSINHSWNFDIYRSDSNNISGLIMYFGERGFWIDGDSDNNNITDCIVQNQTESGIYEIDAQATGNRIYNCFFNNTVNINAVRFNDVANYFNTTEQTGTRIHSSGTNIGGNYWTNETGNGYSDTCADSDKDGFCDLVHNITTNSSCVLAVTCASYDIDQLSLSDEYSEVAGDTCDCSSIQAGTIVDCSENCDITDVCDAEGKDIYIVGEGHIEITADIYNYGRLQTVGVSAEQPCNITCKGGCFRT